MTTELWLAIVAVVVVGYLYSSVGHGGATGYIAALTLLGFSIRETASAALVMNVFVSGIAFYHFYRAGHFKANLILPFLLASIPAAFIGGLWKLDSSFLYALLAITLLFSAGMMVFNRKVLAGSEMRDVSWLSAIGFGALLGLVSGLIGIGGGVFLSPLIVFAGWGTIVQAASASSLFIFANSLSGLAARMVGGNLEMGNLPVLIPFAVGAALLGSYHGANRFSSRILRNLLALVLLIAGIKIGLRLF